MKGIKSARYGIITVLFICACVGLSVGCQTHSQKVYSSQLNEIEAAKLKDLGKTRQHYEDLAENLTRDVAEQGN